MTQNPGRFSIKRLHRSCCVRTKSIQIPAKLRNGTCLVVDTASGSVPLAVEATRCSPPRQLVTFPLFRPVGPCGQTTETGDTYIDLTKYSNIAVPKGPVIQQSQKDPVYLRHVGQRSHMHVPSVLHGASHSWIHSCIPIMATRPNHHKSMPPKCLPSVPSKVAFFLMLDSPQMIRKSTRFSSVLDFYVLVGETPVNKFAARMLLLLGCWG